MLKLYKVSDITNAWVTEVKPMFRIMGEYQWNLQKQTLIREVQHARPNLNNLLENLIPFSHIIDYIEEPKKPVGK